MARTLEGLWPKVMTVLTDEEANTWRRVCDPYPAGTCIRQLRRLAEISKYTPKPADLRKLLRETKSSEAGPAEELPRLTQADYARQRVAFAFPKRSHEAEALTDKEALAVAAKIDYWGALRACGPESLSTKAALKKANKLIDDLPEGWC